MNGRQLERLLWIGAITLAASAGWTWADDPQPAASWTPPQPYAGRPLAGRDSVAEWLAAGVGRDPFRLERRPASVRYGEQPAPERLEPARAERPILVLLGTMGGPPWLAVVEGLPHRAGGAIVRESERIGDLFIRSITRDSVVIEGMDTIWAMPVRRQWR